MYILHIETATKNCSVAISYKDDIICLKETALVNHSHIENTHSFIEACLKEANTSIDKIKAIAVGRGPGSYTGLRIGAAAAKGLCFALNVPLISLCSLSLMLPEAITADYYIPMIDARRMEVYTSVFSKNHMIVEDVSAKILSKNTFERYEKYDLLFLGDGATKLQALQPNLPKARFMNNAYPSACNMPKRAWEKLQRNQTEDIAYWEPRYLKDFIKF